MADANRQKAVREIKIQENILEVEGQKNVSLINNQILEVIIVQWQGYYISSDYQTKVIGKRYKNSAYNNDRYIFEFAVHILRWKKQQGWHYKIKWYDIIIVVLWL